MNKNENPVVKVNLGTMDKVKDFVRTLSTFEGHFDLISGHYMVDAKSILGIFSMNYKDDVDLRIIDANDDMKDVMTALQPFLA
jgi:phosphotransferase system HPr-like phosphotransfer protein